MKPSNIKPGKYVLAVSGGVDSMVLLDLLSRDKNLKLVVAHFNHGIRPDSAKDEQLVAAAANKQGLLLVSGREKLGPGASEAAARRARYNFLKSAKIKHGADGIITAHHQDDLLETAFINILRGTGPKGLISLADNPEIIRPLLGMPKSRLYAYARRHNLAWREDQSNEDEAYLRNYLRQNIMPKLTPEQREVILNNVDKVAKNLHFQKDIIATLSRNILKDDTIDRQALNALPFAAASELLAEWLRKNDLREFDKPLIRRINTILRTGLPGTRHDLSAGVQLVLSRAEAKLQTGL